MVPRGLEPRTLRLLAVRSNQLSYETLVVAAKGRSIRACPAATKEVKRERRRLTSFRRAAWHKWERSRRRGWATKLRKNAVLFCCEVDNDGAGALLLALF